MKFGEQNERRHGELQKVHKSSQTVGSTDFVLLRDWETDILIWPLWCRVNEGSSDSFNGGVMAAITRVTLSKSFPASGRLEAVDLVQISNEPIDLFRFHLATAEDHMIMQCKF